MADFEGLIRQALTRQNDADPAIRQRIYESSRRALARMIAAAGMQPPEVIARQHEALENAILGIEEEYLLAEMQQAEAADASRGGNLPWADNSRRTGPFSQPRLDPRIADPRARPAYVEPVAEPVNEATGQSYDDSPDAGYEEQEYAPADLRALPRRRSSFSRAVGILAIVVAIAVAGWLIYAAGGSLLDRGSPGAQSGAAGDSENPAQRDTAENSTYITILSPADTAALDTAGRGKADIVNQSNIEMIRLVSLRAENRRNEPALPIVLTLVPGVLSQIAGNRVTVEILAKSGSAGPVGFAIGCELEGEDVCGRKRFRVGIQPEAIVFTMNVKPEMAQSKNAFLTINTDITSAAALTGEGDPVDILYARLRLPKG